MKVGRSSGSSDPPLCDDGRSTHTLLRRVRGSISVVACRAEELGSLGPSKRPGGRTTRLARSCAREARRVGGAHSQAKHCATAWLPQCSTDRTATPERPAQPIALSATARPRSRIFFLLSSPCSVAQIRITPLTLERVKMCRCCLSPDRMRLAGRCGLGSLTFFEVHVASRPLMRPRTLRLA
jgi:hypothetical protein